MSELTNMEGMFVITNKKKYSEKDLDIWIFLRILKYRNKSYGKRIYTLRTIISFKRIGI
jgi:hypothetical protein